MEVEDTIRKIKSDLRLSMNGVASAAMRERGLVYKLNFGVELPRIKAIASHYLPDPKLACALWKEEIRECKILAALLQPTEGFDSELAEVWVEDIRTIEIAELTVMNLFVRLPYAPAKSFVWIADEREYVQTCGFLLAARLLSRGLELHERAANELLDQAQAALEGAPYFPRKAARLALQKYAEQSDANAKKVLLFLNKE